PEHVRDQMLELADLTRTAGAEVVGSEVQKRTGIEPAHFIGMGKVDALRELKLEGAFDMVVCNEDLSPRQQRNLERELQVRVFDRTEVILEIFAQHARTHEGRLQVEAARLHHLLPRLIGAYSYDRQVGGRRGGVGARGGAGEQQIETGRRLLLTDTVGFIQKLPTDLVAAFRATLEEVTEADVVIQVLDASSPSVLDQAATVDEELNELGAGDKPRVVALNKVDMLGPAARRRLVGAIAARYPGVAPISAT